MREHERGELGCESERHELRVRKELSGGPERVSEINRNQTSGLQVYDEVGEMSVSDTDDVLTDIEGGERLDEVSPQDKERFGTGGDSEQTTSQHVPWNLPHFLVVLLYRVSPANLLIHSLVLAVFSHP